MDFKLPTTKKKKKNYLNRHRKGHTLTKRHSDTEINMHTETLAE